MSDDDDTIRIVCVELSLIQLGLLAGNQARDCDLCGRGVVLSTEGQAFEKTSRAEGRPVEIICIPCAKEHAADEEIGGVVPGAVERARREGYPLSERTAKAIARTPIEEWPE